MNEQQTKQMNNLLNTTNQYNLFFNGEIGNNFNGKKDLYLGDKDFIFADDFVNINAEVKTISINYQFTGKKLTFIQAREYSAEQDLIDNMGRTKKNFLFEYHKYLKKPYIIVVPFKKYSKEFTKPIDFLDMKKAKMVYVKNQQQLIKWISGDRYVGATPRKPLLCV